MFLFYVLTFNLLLFAVKPASTISKSLAWAIHSTLAIGNGDWVKSFTRQRNKKALSTKIVPGRLLGRGAPRTSAFVRAQ